MEERKKKRKEEKRKERKKTNKGRKKKHTAMDSADEMELLQIANWSGQC